MGRASVRLQDSAAGPDPALDDHLRRQVPAIFVVATGALAVLIVTAVSVHLAIGSFRDYPHGVSLLQEDLVQVASSTRNMRIQSLSHSAAQSAGTKGELEPEAIRFEKDNKAGGGDLMVPVSMVDYENLGEGSIVDQRYPRRLPGQDELEAEWNALWDWSPSPPPAEEPPPAPAAVKALPKVPAIGEQNKLEDMGVNVNGYRKDGKK